MFTAQETERLLLRPAQAGDLDVLVARRSDPQVAAYQSWDTPYPRDRAEQLLRAATAMPGPADDEWFMITVVAQGEIIGDLAVLMSWGMRTAEIGFTLAPAAWGKGYATEAVDGLLDYLLEDVGVTRVAGTLHPDNVASAQVLERTGFLYEGRTRSSYWVGDEVYDDLIYGMTAEDRRVWRDRPRHTPAEVELVVVDQSNEREVAKLSSHKSQERFVAPMTWSYADALFPEIIDGAPLVPWMRAIRADGELVGFVMLAQPTDHHPEPYLWRLLIDRLHQRRSIGLRALDRVVEECRAMGAATLVTSWGEGRGSPEPFYLAYGFEPTGGHIDHEIEARLRF